MKGNLLTAAALLAALAAPVQAQRGPAPVSTNLPPEVLSLACASKAVFEPPDRSLRITGGQDSVARYVYGPGDLITINAGTDNGIEVGQEYYVRRVEADFAGTMGYKSRTAGQTLQQTPSNIRTSGWIKVYAVEKQMSLVTVTHACDTIGVDDFLEPFVLPVVPEAAKDRFKAERDNYGHILFGTDMRRTFGKGDFFTIDRGSNDGVKPGMRFAIYRDKKQAENFLYDLGEAVAVDVSPATSTLQAIASRDAFVAGDYVAMKRVPKQ